MLNQTVIVGRLTKNVELEEVEGKKTGILTLEVPRSFKNEDGEYETDFIDCRLWNGVCETTYEYCRKGDLIGIKGRIQTRNIENEDGTFSKIMEVIAEKVTFLSSKKQDEE